MTSFRKLLMPLMCMACLWAANAQPPVVHSHIGQKVEAPGALTITNVGKRQQHDWRDKATLDTDIFSPKSVNFHPDGSKYYVNSLEGCATVVYATNDNHKIKVIHHRFESGTGTLWAPASGYYRFTHYPDGERRAFSGKPVESTFSHGGRYLWVPYYRRTFDINAQDPSAVAIIDTRTDSIVRMMETGPLPKMIACSHDGRTIAVTHWGNNTVGLIDVAGNDPKAWHHLPYVVVDHELALNFSLTHEVNRDANSGLLLRGTVFTPDDKYLLVGCMGGGGIAVIDLTSHKYVGKIGGISNARHLIINHGYLYASVNNAGLVQRVPLDSVLSAIASRQGSSIGLRCPWQVCKVGSGARTIEASPSGRFIFAACNSSSALYAIDTRQMKVVAQIPIDSYPVGLDISRDGHMLVVTSQARNYQGGNAVNLLRVDYADEAAERAAATTMPQPADTLATDSVAPGEPVASTGLWKTITGEHWPVAATLAVVALLTGVFIYSLRKK